MTNLEFLELLGDVSGKYILEAQRYRTASRKPHRHTRQLAAVLALILILAAFLCTAPGAAAVEAVKEKAASLIETLFPPKTMRVDLEGMENTDDYVADGVEPDATAEAPQPGFAIYYDVDHYTMEKVEDSTYIRPYWKPLTREEVLERYDLSYLSGEELEREIAALMNLTPDPSLPVCEIEITHGDIPCEQAAFQQWVVSENQGEITVEARENRITFCMVAGHSWNSPVEDWDYISDGQGGHFRIIRRYFLEATEGHGMRFAAMVNTFTVLPPPESAQKAPSGMAAPAEKTKCKEFQGTMTVSGQETPVELCYYQAKTAQYFCALKIGEQTITIPLRKDFVPGTVANGFEVHDVNRDGHDDILIEHGIFGQLRLSSCYVHTPDGFRAVPGFDTLCNPTWSETGGVVVEQWSSMPNSGVNRYRVQGTQLILEESLLCQHRLDGREGGPWYTVVQRINGELVTAKQCVQESEVDLEYWYS